MMTEHTDPNTKQPAESKTVLNGIVIEKADGTNFSETSMDDFDRFQTVRKTVRFENGEPVLYDASFSETWSLERRREKAREILSDIFLTYCAFCDGCVIGEIMLLPELDNGRLIIDSFHVSRAYRRRGIGKKLLDAARREAEARGAKALYVSAMSAEETIRFYTANGFRPTDNPIPFYREEEPYDIQMECEL